MSLTDAFDAVGDPAEQHMPPLRAGLRVITLGCRLNAAESETMRAHALQTGAGEGTNAASALVIINSCAVTAEAVRQTRQTIRRQRRLDPAARIVVTGCAAQIDPDGFAAMPEVDLVLGNDEKLKPDAFSGLSTTGAARVRVNDIFAVRQTAAHLLTDARPGEAFAGRTRAYVQVQNGCDHRCTFCIIPFGRGAARSVPAGEAVAQIRALARAGWREVVLTGVDLTSWGGDLPGRPQLGNLVARILKLVPELPRLRISSVDAVEADPELLRVFAGEERLAPFLHLSLQAGDDLILKRMKRRHSRAEAVEFCARLREIRPDCALGADLIAGFPTEDEAAFDNTRRLIADCGLAFVHVFPFSARAGTPASRMPRLDRTLVKARAAILRAEAGFALSRHFASRIGRRMEILLEKPDFGRAADFTPVRFAGSAGEAGDFVTATILADGADALSAAIV